MAFAQINYPQPLGTGPTVASIADVGCFLTSFCNLLERYGEAVDPPTLNNYFIAHGAYMADGNDRDWLGWGSISAYDGNIVSSQVGGAGWPQTNDAIVKFIYRSARTGASVTHFCLVADWTAGTIVDSWDGRVKSSPYGQPVAWSTYERHSAQVVTPPAPAETPAYSVETIGSQMKQLTVNTSLWDLNQRTWPGIVNNPLSGASAGDTFTTTRIAHQVLGGSYYMPDGTDGQGYNIVDCRDYTPPQPSTPPSAPLTPGGNPDNTYNVIRTVAGYRTATDAGNHTNQVNEVVAGNYYVFNTHAANSDLVNVTSILGQAGSWINKQDNVPDAPTPPPAPEPTPVPEPAPVVDPPSIPANPDPAPWKSSYVPFPNPVHYIAGHALMVSDLSDEGKQPDMPLPKYANVNGKEVGVVSAYGTVTKDGVDYYRLKTNNDPNFTFWYSVPKLDPNTRTPSLLVKPTDPGLPITKTTAVKDGLQVAFSRLELEVPKFFDDMVPKWLKNKK